MRLPTAPLFLLLVASLFLVACEAFENITPSNIKFSMRGSGGSATIILSKDFAAGVDEQAVTRVQVFESDMVVTTLPFDTVMDISGEQRWLVHVVPVGSDTLDVDVFVGVDDRTLFSDSGPIFPGMPWQYVYVFNESLTSEIDVTF